MTQNDDQKIDLLSLIRVVTKYYKFLLLFNIIIIIASYFFIEIFHKDKFRETFVVGHINKEQRQTYDYIEVLNDLINYSFTNISRKHSNVFYGEPLVYSDPYDTKPNDPSTPKYGVPFLDPEKIIIDLFYTEVFLINNNVFSNNIRFLEPELDRSVAAIKGIDAQAFHTIEISGRVDNYDEIKNAAMNLFVLAEEDLGTIYRSIFSKKIEVYRDSLKYKLLSLENEIQNLQKSIVEQNLLKINLLKQQLQIAENIGIEKNNFLPVLINEEITLAKLDKNILSENYYLKGYETISAEIENLESDINNYVSEQTIELIKLKDNLEYYIDVDMYNEILNELPFFNDNIDFKAGVIKVNSFYEITTSKLLIFISSFVLSIIASLLLVLIRILSFGDQKIF